ncbi:ubiquinone/menaquinone biosynthesis methyltransferase [Oceanidesulfovibrio marinus]|nr:ubiquinone/menaquinone biosynthesis methyltransferase [Oceanidesulfovibrio marinus]
MTEESLQEAERKESHAGRVRSMFGRISRWYDFLNHFLSLGLDIHWRKVLVREAEPPGGRGHIVDLAAGTLDVTVMLAKRYQATRITAVDFSKPMLDQGASKISKRGLEKRVSRVVADGRRLPLADGSAQCMTVAFGIRNIVPRQDAYAEVLRVLEPGGQFLILEFGSGKKRILRGIYNLYLNYLLPLAGRIVSGDKAAYQYLADTIRAFPDERALARELLDAGFETVYCLPLSWGIVNLHIAETPRRAEG